MTKREEIYRFIEKYIQQEGFPPDYRSIAAVCAIGLHTVSYHLTELEYEGYITRQPRRWRSMKLTGKPFPSS